jgi:MSHA biogenesis protein MshJ
VRERLHAGIRWLDAQTLRERVLVVAAALVGVYAIWDLAIMSPLDAERRDVAAEAETVRTQIESLRNEFAALETRFQGDPNAENRDRRAALVASIAQLDRQLGERTDDLIPPSEMPRVLRDLVELEGALQIVRLESLPVESLLKVEEGQTPARARVYKHGLVLELQGDYLATLEYLESLEALPWNLLWDSLEYRVDEYPYARVKLVVYSLSTQEGWIGV